MVKKMLKYAKFMMCCALIFSLVLPSYAALSASDGSAFVTKAEFDSALADFNSRLTTFEAGINSKIDSQVTSYLDRNGIWNKKSIVFSNGKETYSVTSGLTADAMKNLKTSVSKTFKKTENNWVKIEKSGLCNMIFKQTKTGYRSLAKGSKGDAAWSVYSWYVQYVLIDDVGNESVSATVMIFQTNGSYEFSGSSNDWQQIFLGYVPGTYPTYFFVSRGDRLRFEEHVDSKCYKDWGGTNIDYQSGDNPVYEFFDCGVY